MQQALFVRTSAAWFPGAPERAIQLRSWLDKILKIGKDNKLIYHAGQRWIEARQLQFQASPNEQAYQGFPGRLTAISKQRGREIVIQHLYGAHFYSAQAWNVH
jgi:hypothetical protein